VLRAGQRNAGSCVPCRRSSTASNMSARFGPRRPATTPATSASGGLVNHASCHPPLQSGDQTNRRPLPPSLRRPPGRPTLPRSPASSSVATRRRPSRPRRASRRAGAPRSTPLLRGRVAPVSTRTGRSAVRWSATARTRPPPRPERACHRISGRDRRGRLSDDIISRHSCRSTSIPSSTPTREPDPRQARTGCLHVQQRAMTSVFC